MNKLLLLSGLILFGSLRGYCQGEENVWAFGYKAGVDFNGPAPVTFESQASTLPPFASGVSEANASVCNAAGELLFYTNGHYIWDRSHNLMANGSEITGFSGPTVTISTTQGAAIAPMPDSANLYYVFSLTEYEMNQNGGRLYYSIVDMNLNGGMGGVVPGRKGIFIDSNFTEAMYPVVGKCANFWLLLHERDVPVFKAFEVTHLGISEPVVSSVGSVLSSKIGRIVSTPDRTRLAYTSFPGFSAGAFSYLELYDFDPASGVVSNPVTLTTNPSEIPYGLCFSPDNTKLYTSINPYDGVFQYDLSLPTLPAIIASRIQVGNSTSQTSGDMKVGPDGKIYVGNGVPGSYLGIIHFPNIAGTGCNYVREGLPFSPGSYTYSGLPNQVPVIHFVRDTVINKYTVGVCFNDSIRLQATDTTASGYFWNGSSMIASCNHNAEHQGWHSVQYMNSCQFMIDSFDVVFTGPVPTLSLMPSCDSQYTGRAAVITPPGFSTSYSYSWYDASGTLIRYAQSANGDTLSGIGAGMYSVKLQPWPGCDTTLHFEILPVNVPHALFVVDTAVCIDKPVLFINHSTTALGSTLAVWGFGDGASANEFSPTHSFGQAGTYTVSLVAENLEHCMDTMTKNIEVHDFSIGLAASPEVADIGATIKLITSAGEPYTVLAWSPAELFNNQSAYDQNTTLTSETTFRVKGISAIGCVDTTEMLVMVNPTVFIPSVFSPNNDGRNDYFRPLSAGGEIRVVSFLIYNRWGNAVFTGYGNTGSAGWDGMYGGQPAEQGTYFYQIELRATSTGKIYTKKGDVTLVR